MLCAHRVAMHRNMAPSMPTASQKATSCAQTASNGLFANTAAALALRCHLVQVTRDSYLSFSLVISIRLGGRWRHPSANEDFGTPNSSALHTRWHTAGVVCTSCWFIPYISRAARFRHLVRRAGVGARLVSCPRCKNGPCTLSLRRSIPAVTTTFINYFYEAFSVPGSGSRFRFQVQIPGVFFNKNIVTCWKCCVH